MSKGLEHTNGTKGSSSVPFTLPYGAALPLRAHVYFDLESNVWIYAQCSSNSVKELPVNHNYFTKNVQLQPWHES